MLAHKESVLPLPILVLTPILLLAILLTVACGSGNGSNGEPLTLEGYFQTLAKANANAAERADKILEEAEPDTLVGWRKFVEEFGAFTDDFINTLKVVSPPPEVKNQHDKILVMATEIQATAREFADKVEQAESLREAAPIIEQFGGRMIELGRPLDSACRALQNMADEKGFEIDLGCES